MGLDARHHRATGAIGGRRQELVTGLVDTSPEGRDEVDLGRTELDPVHLVDCRSAVSRIDRSFSVAWWKASYLRGWETQSGDWEFGSAR